MTLWRRLELEWKVLLLAAVLFVAFVWPVQRYFISRLTTTLDQAIDPNLETTLRTELADAGGVRREAIKEHIERYRQTRVLIPFVVREQQQLLLALSVGLFILFLLLSYWVLSRLTRPLKQLAGAVDRIAKGEAAQVNRVSGGALGVVEQAVINLQSELMTLREKARIQGMESAWKDIARVMAHEIKNPLTPIRLTLDRIEERAATAQHGLDDFKAAVAATRQQITERQQAVEERLSDVASLIFTAHLMLLQDDLFYGHIVSNISAGMSAERAILTTARHYVALFSTQDNPYMREKADDIRDLSIRVFENLQGTEQATAVFRDHIIIARELLPSDILILSSEGIAGVVLIAGGVTSHLSVLARSLGIPLIIADEPHLLDLPAATTLLLDGDTGNVHVNPDETIRNNFEQREEARRKLLTHRDAIADVTRTADGVPISLLANINLLSDVKTARDLKCEGVGLYRTEFPFIIRSTFPTEEEQVIVYRKLVEGMEGKPVTFRTLDIGGDKILPYYDHFAEQNPFLGMRSIRFALRNMDIFRQQVRAILRAGEGAQLGIMFPMVSTVEELIDARKVVSSCIDELRGEQLPFNDAPRIGIMIEIPAMVEIIDTVADMVDFFSIGTNDFVQYMLAVDRTNEKVAALYLPHHPAVLRALNRIVQTATAHGKPVSICGDMAHQVEYLPFLLGIGITALSVDAVYSPQLQKTIAGISLVEAKKTAALLLRESSTSAIGRLLGIDG